MILSRDEIIELVNRIRKRDFASEAELDALEYRLEDGTSDPRIREYMFAALPPMTSEEIADRVLAHNPIQLPDQTGGN